MSLALDLIRKEKEERTGYLDIGNCGLTELPEELFELVWLETLIVSNDWWDVQKNKWINSQNNGKNNYLEGKLPDGFQHFKNLKRLNIGAGKAVWKLSNINSIHDLNQLAYLDISDNKPIKNYFFLNAFKYLKHLNI